MSDSSVWSRRRKTASRIGRGVEGLHPNSPGAYLFQGACYDTAAEVRRAFREYQDLERMAQDEGGAL